MSLTIKDIIAAESRIREIVEPTPLQHNQRLSDMYHANIYLKREDLQPVRSYKIRGAYNAVSCLSPAERKHGVVCASAGNHAQGVAMACARAKCHATIFMPTTTPLQKVNRVHYFGGTFVDVVLEGSSYDDAAAGAHDYAAKHAAYFVHPFNDALTIAGQGTVALEIFQQMGNPPDALIVPVGGGGLLAGSSVVAHVDDRKCQLYAAEPSGAASMAAAHDSGQPVTLDSLDTFVDGAAVRTVGADSFALVKNHDVRLVAVPNGLLCKEMIELYQNDGIITEPAGALSLAALELLRSKIRGKTVVCVVSGGNNDISRYPEIVERSLIYQGLKHYFLIDFPQQPGQLRRFLDQALSPSDDIVRFEYTKKNNKGYGPALVGIELAAKTDLQPLLKRMDDLGVTYQDITNDQLLFNFLV